MSVPIMLSCPHCPGSTRLFSQHGLKVHVGRMHKQTLSSGAQDRVVGVPPSQQHWSIEDLGKLKKTIPLLKHIPKGARSVAAEQLSSLMNRCVDTNGTEDWCTLLTFAYRALRVPSKSGSGGLTHKVKANILSVDTLLPENLELCGSPSWGRSLAKTIESKVHEGDLRGAVRLLMSDDTLAEASSDTLSSLISKHPSPSRVLNFPDAPDNSIQPVTVTCDDVCLALGTFHAGSAAGLDGIRPGHLKELISGSAGDNGSRLLESLTKLTNYILSGKVNLEVCPFLYGASLVALKKKDGGLRPIAVGSTYRRLVAKLACGFVKERMASYLQPHQLGFGVKLGCEAAIHATRAFSLRPENSNKIIVKLDIQNAFNSIERDVLLGEIRENCPALYPFLYQVYYYDSNLYFDNNLISSRVGAQQGDPLGPLIFSLGIQKIISNLKSPLNMWYLDDGTIGGTPDEVRGDLLSLIPQFEKVGLKMNAGKCEFFPCDPTGLTSFSSLSTVLPGLKVVNSDSFTLLGSPIFPSAVRDSLLLRKSALLSAHARLKDISKHEALVLLKFCFAVPKLTYFLRTVPTWLYSTDVAEFDEALKLSVESILNVDMNKIQWTQASLPIRHGGLGVRRMCDVGLPAFLASAHGVVSLVTSILPTNGDQVSIPFAAEAREAWLSLYTETQTPSLPAAQRSWDEVGAKKVLERLLEEATGVDLARLKAVSRNESGAWLQALPSPHLGTLLDSDSLRVAAALRLGCNICEIHACICGSTVETNGHHALSCNRCHGRFPRHHALNDLIRRALISANVPCVLEPPGLSRSDGKRPDGLTLVPWQRGRSLIWDATCVNTFATSHLPHTMNVAGAAAETAARNKHVKYAPLEQNYVFFPFAVETAGCWGSEGMTFVRDIGRRLRDRGHDHRSGAFLIQRLAIAIQRGNAACIMGSFVSGTVRGGLFE